MNSWHSKVRGQQYQEGGVFLTDPESCHRHQLGSPGPQVPSGFLPGLRIPGGRGLEAGSWAEGAHTPLPCDLLVVVIVLVLLQPLHRARGGVGSPAKDLHGARRVTASVWEGSGPAHFCKQDSGQTPKKCEETGRQKKLMGAGETAQQAGVLPCCGQPGFILGTQYGPLSLPGVILKHRARSKA